MAESFKEVRRVTIEDEKDLTKPSVDLKGTKSYVTEGFRESQGVSLNDDTDVLKRDNLEGTVNDEDESNLVDSESMEIREAPEFKEFREAKQPDEPSPTSKHFQNISSSKTHTHKLIYNIQNRPFKHIYIF